MVDGRFLALQQGLANVDMKAMDQDVPGAFDAGQRVRSCSELSWLPN
jgi:hypothetical protein